MEALCALAVAFLCPGLSQAATYTLKLAKDYPIRDLEQVLFKVECFSKCQIHDIRVDKLKGKVTWYADSDATLLPLCTSWDRSCNVTKRIDETEFYITLKPDPSFSSGNLIVKLGQKGARITELNAEGAMRLSKNLIRMKSGYKKPEKDEKPERYRIQCNGTCNNLKFAADKDILVAASKEPVFETDDGCLNCFCVWKQNQTVNPNCNSSGNIGSSTIYVDLINYRKIKDAKAYVWGNFASVELYNHYDVAGPYDYENGYKAVAAPVTGPIDNDYELNFDVYCENNTRCTDIKIEILTHSTSLVKTVQAGKNTTLTSKGQCRNCDCSSRQSCLGRFNPSLADHNGGKYFKINIKLGNSNRKYPAWVRVSGKGLGWIQNMEQDYYYYIYYIYYDY